MISEQVAGNAGDNYEVNRERGQKTMRKQRVRAALILALVCALARGTACAEFDVMEYTYDELIVIQQQVADRLEELERQNAIEHANRTFLFEEEEQVVFVRQTTKQEPVVTILDESAPAKTKFIWSSSDPEIATVTMNGTVSGVSSGDAVITATAEDNPYLAVSYTVHVANPVEQITVWGPDNQLVLGGDPEDAEAELGFSIEPEDAYNQEVIWSSSDETIVTVDEDGYIRGLQPGTATITVSSNETPIPGKRKVQATYEVKVLQAVTVLECPQTSLIMNAGEKAALNMTALPENASNTGVLYMSSNPEVADVDERGNIRAINCGECDIICTAADGYGASASCHIQVKKLISSITIAEETIMMPIGTTRTVEAEILPEDASEQGLIWTSTNVFVARVAGGRVEAIGQGDCEITCTAMDGSNISASVKVHVPSFGVEQTEYSVTKKEGLTIPVVRNKKECEIIMEAASEYFTATLMDDELKIEPISAGTDTIMLSNPEAPDDTVQIQITIENSAVFNQESYPAISYMELMRDPDMYENQPVSLFGRVIQILGEEDGKKVFMIGTGGDTYTDQVIRVRCDQALLPEEGIREDEMLTVYGLFHTDRSYSEQLQVETIVPTLDTEKIVLQ